MPSTHQASDDGERLRCPNLIEAIGEDPARWLDRPIVGHPNRETVVRTLIDGMDSLERVRAWKACELRLANPQEDDNPRNPLDEPRGAIIQRLDQREEWLQLHGERADRVPLGPREPCDCCGGEPELTAADLRERDRREVERLAEAHKSGGVDTSETTSTTDVATLGQYATDGGADQ